MDEHGKRRLVVGGLVFIIALMMVQNYFLVRKNDGLVYKLEDANAARGEAGMLADGDTIQAFSAIGENGVIADINPARGTGKTLFFVFTTGCPSCAKNMEKWNWIAKQNSGKQVRIVGLCPDSIDRISEFELRHEMAFSAYSLVNDSLTGRLLKLKLFPQTILVDSMGRVVDAWAGLLSDKRRDEILKAL